MKDFLLQIFTWWNGQTMRFFIRVNARNSATGTYELYRLGDAWFLSRVLD